MTPGERHALEESLKTVAQSDLEEIEREMWQTYEKASEQLKAAQAEWACYRNEITRRTDDARILETAKKLAKQMVTAEVQA